MEHRCGVRYEVDLAVYARTHGGTVSSVGWLRDISLSGGFLYTTVPVQLFARVSLRLIGTDGQFGPRLEGQVVRVSPVGLGIEWSEYVPEVVRDLIGQGRSRVVREIDSSSSRHAP